MQRQPFVRDIWRSLTNGLETSIRRALAAGVRRSQIILDPGLGFGKPRRQNYEILAGLARLQRFHLPILDRRIAKIVCAGDCRGEGLNSVPAAKFGSTSRGALSKRIKRPAQAKPDSSLLTTGDAAFVAAAILAGAHIVRVHDPAAILPAVRVADALLAARG